MKKKRDTRRNSKKNSKFVENFLAFGNQKSVFRGITFSTVILSVIAIPMILSNKQILNYFLLVWILELIYIAFYLNKKK